MSRPHHRTLSHLIVLGPKLHSQPLLLATANTCDMTKRPGGITHRSIQIPIAPSTDLIRPEYSAANPHVSTCTTTLLLQTQQLSRAKKKRHHSHHAPPQSSCNTLHHTRVVPRPRLPSPRLHVQDYACRSNARRNAPPNRQLARWNGRGKAQKGR